MAWEAGRTSVSGTFKSDRSARILRASESLAERLNDRYTNAFVFLARGCMAYFDGCWAAAESSLSIAEDRFLEYCTGVTWELDTTRTFSLWSLLYMGKLADMSRRLTILVREAQERGDLYFLMNLSTYIMSFVMAGNDEAAEAREALSRITERWSQRGFHVQHHNVLLATVLLDLYEGNAHAARKYIRERLPLYRKSLMLQVQQVRVDVDQLRARTALAVAVKSGDPRSFLAEAERAARRLERERRPLGNSPRSLDSGRRCGDPW